MGFLTVDEVYFALALLHSPGVGHANAKFALSHFPDLSKLFQSNKSKLLKIPGIGEKAAAGIQSGIGKFKAEEIIKNAQKEQISIIPFFDEEYPKKLRQIIDAPFVLYLKGAIDLNFNKTIGIVGTRDATTYGIEVTGKIINENAIYNPCIISGLAYGIDIASHRKAIECKLPTVAILAGGLDRVYPSIHQKTVDRMLINGGILSEQPPGTKPDAHLFPARNRIIAGLSDTVIVVEAKAKGGALITAELADSYNKPVFAVPGNLNQVTSEGCNLLIRNQKALIYTGVKDLQYHLNWTSEINHEKTSHQLKPLPELNDNEKTLYQLLVDHPAGIHIDELSWKSEIQINLLSSILLSLEFKGLLKPLPGKKYKAIK